MTIVRDAQSVMLPSERRYIENVIRLLCRGGIEEEEEVLLTLIEKDDKYIRDIKGKKAEEHMENIYAEYVLSVYNKDISSVKESYDILKKSFLVYIANNIEK